MIRRTVVFALALCLCGMLLTAERAQAVVLVFGQGLGVDCYLKAEYADPSEAFDLCSIALAQPSMTVHDRAATYINRSVVRLRVKDYSGALHDCDESIAIAPTIGEGYVDRGAALLNMNRSEEALQSLTKGIGLGIDKMQIAYYNRGLAKEFLHDTRGAYADYKKAVELDPGFALALEQLKRFSVVGTPSS